MLKALFALIIMLVFSICPFYSHAEMETAPVDVVIRGPAAEVQADDRDRLLEITGRIETIYDHKTFLANSLFAEWNVGEVVAVESQNPSIGVVAFVEVTSVEKKVNGTYAIKFELLRHSRTSFMQVGDSVFKLSLSTENPRYKGTTDLVIKKRSDHVSSRYKPLITQGVNIGDTAQTLWKNEFLLTWYGLMNFGVTDSLTLSSVLPLNFTGATNAQFKYKAFETDSNVLSAGFSYANVPSEKRSTLNLNLLWDGISSESQVSHTFITIALLSFEKADETTAIRSFGTSSFQSGYEFILNDWDRFLIGPNYNFEKKAVGGYVSYVKIWDKFHFSLSMNSTDITAFRLSTQDGYYFFFDAYWRF